MIELTKYSKILVIKETCLHITLLLPVVRYFLLIEVNTITK